MRKSTLSGPVWGRGSISRLGSASGSKVRGCDEVGLVRGAFGEGTPSEPLASLEGGVGTLSWGVVGEWYCEMPAATAVLVWTHRRKGLECMMILRFFLGRPCALPSLEMLSLLKSRWAGSLVVAFFASSACWMSRSWRRAAMRWPRAFAWDQPPYVRGGSYGVGEERCHDLSAASSRAPCLGGS